MFSIYNNGVLIAKDGSEEFWNDLNKPMRPIAKKGSTDYEYCPKKETKKRKKMRPMQRRAQNGKKLQNALEKF